MALVQRKKHVLFDDVIIKWIWGDWELMQFREMWNEGVGISDISKALKCNRKSIVLLVIDQADEGLLSNEEVDYTANKKRQDSSRPSARLL